MSLAWRSARFLRRWVPQETHRPQQTLAATTLRPTSGVARVMQFGVCIFACAVGAFADGAIRILVSEATITFGPNEEVKLIRYAATPQALTLEGNLVVTGTLTTTAGANLDTVAGLIVPTFGIAFLEGPGVSVSPASGVAGYEFPVNALAGAGGGVTLGTNGLNLPAGRTYKCEFQTASLFTNDGFVHASIYLNGVKQGVILSISTANRAVAESNAPSAVAIVTGGLVTARLIQGTALPLTTVYKASLWCFAI